VYSKKVRDIVRPIVDDMRNEEFLDHELLAEIETALNKYVNYMVEQDGEYTSITTEDIIRMIIGGISYDVTQSLLDKGLITTDGYSFELTDKGKMEAISHELGTTINLN